MGKKPLREKQIKSIRKMVESKPHHSLLLNLSVDLMLRGSDMLNLKVSDVMNESGSVKKEVKVRQKKTKKTTLSLPLRKSQEDYIFKGQKSYTGKPIFIIQYSRIVKGWLTDLGYENVSQYSTHSMRKSKASLIYEKTKNVDAVRRLLGQSSVTATSAYLGVTDESALDFARQYHM